MQAHSNDSVVLEEVTLVHSKWIRGCPSVGDVLVLRHSLFKCEGQLRHKASLEALADAKEVLRVLGSTPDLGLRVLRVQSGIPNTLLCRPVAWEGYMKDADIPVVKIPNEFEAFSVWRPKKK